MEAEGWELFKKGQKKMKGWGLFGNKFEEAQELFTQSGNKFKGAKVWDAAADAFMQAASCAVKSAPYEAGTLFVEAAQAYRKADGKVNDAVTCYNEAIKLSIDNGRFGNAAKYEREIGSMYQDKRQTNEAIQHLHKSADYYETENQSSSANGVRVQIGEILMNQDRFKEAYNIFDGLAHKQDKGVQIQIRDHVFKAILCLMGDKLSEAQDALALADALTAIREKLEEYAALDMRFSGSREYELVERLLHAYEGGEIDHFKAAVRDFDDVRSLPDWATAILVRVQRTLVAGPEMPSLV